MALPRPTVEVQWEQDVWTEITDEVSGFSTDHGGSTANPDRPLPLPAKGAMIVAGPAPLTGQRFLCRATMEGDELWEGWAQAPRELKNPQRARWTLEGKSKERLPLNVETSIAAGTTAQLLAATPLSPLGPITARNLAARNLKAITYSGRLGGLLSRACLVASAEAIENRSGQIIAASPHLAATPANPPTIAARETTVYDLDTAHQIDRIRNQGTIRIEEISNLDSSTYSARITLTTTGNRNAAITNPLQLAGSIPVPADGATYSNWAAEVVSGRWTVPVSVSLYDLSARPPASWTYQVVAFGNVAYGGAATAAAGAEANGAIPITASAPTSVVETWACRTQIGRALGTTTTSTPTINRAGFWGTRTAQQSSNFGTQYPLVQRSRPAQLELTILVTATRTTGTTTPARDLQVTNTASQALWGVRELDLPFWIAADNTAALQAQIDGLAAVRDEHTFTVPLTEPIARTIDAGDYVSLRIEGTNELCLVVGRGLRFGDGQIPRARFRCLETGVRVEHNDVYLGALANPVYLGDTDHRVHLYR